MNLREQLLANKPRVKKCVINGTDCYVREFNIGETNKAIYGQQQILFKIEEEQGVELDFSDEEKLSKQLSKIHDPYQIARTFATRICDENGNNLFDPDNIEDLEQISKLEKAVFEDFSKAIVEFEAKNSPSVEDSK